MSTRGAGPAPPMLHNGKINIRSLCWMYGLDRRQARRLRRKWAAGWRGPVGGTAQSRRARKEA